MPAYLTPLLLLLASPLAGGVGVEPGVRAAEHPAPQIDYLRAEFEDLRARHEQARRGLAGSPDGARVADQAFRGQFAELAARGSGRATAWFLRTFPLAHEATRQEQQVRLEMFEQLARDEADRAWLLDPAFDLFEVLLRDAEVLGRGPAIDLAEAFARAATVDETRARALGTAACLEATWTEPDPARRKRAEQRHAEVIERFPDTAQAQASRDALWRLSKLAVGKLAPGFIASDVDGNEIRLGDLHRRVLVVEFWSANDPAARAWADHRAKLVERHIDERFFLLGVNLDQDAQSFRRALEGLGIEWLNAFTGASQGSAASTGPKQAVWRMTQGGTNLVLDANGVVRHVDLHGAELEAAVAALIAEGRAQRGAPQAKTNAGVVQGL